MSSSCVGVTEAGAVFAVPVSIADKLLSAVFTGQTVIGFPPHLFRMGVPPCISASVGTKVFGLSALHLENWFPAPAASDPNRIFRRVAADVGADGIDGKPKGNRNVCGTLVMAAHEIQRLDFLFGHMRNLPDLICGGNNPFEFAVFVRKTPGRCPNGNPPEIMTVPPRRRSPTPPDWPDKYPRVFFPAHRRVAPA